MKVAVIGTFGTGLLATSLARGFTSAGCEVTRVSDRAAAPAGRARRLAAHSWPAIAGPFLLKSSEQERLVESVASARPDLVLLVKCAYVTRRTVGRVRAASGAMVVNWMPDDPFVALRPAVPISALSACDAIVSYSDSVCHRLESDLKVPAHSIAFGFDPHDYQPDVQVVAQWDVTFVGQHSAHREGVVAELMAAGLQTRVFGPRWYRARASVRAAWDPAESYGPAACRRYHLGRVGINILHPRNNVDSHNMRTFEIPATGRAMVTTDTVQQRRLLRGISGIGYYTGSENLRARVHELLSTGEAPLPTTMATHTYEQRCRQLLNLVGR
jgi:hypothetical protein